MPGKIERAIFTTVVVLSSSRRAVYVPGTIKKAVFTTVEVLRSSWKPVYVPGKIERAVFTTGTWCTKNDARALFPVGARSDKMAVRKTSIFGKVYVFSDTVFCAFSEAAFGEILASIQCPKTSPIRNIFW